MRCPDAQILVPLMLDNELARDDLNDLQVHLAECEACREHVRFETGLRAAIQRRLVAPPPAGLRERVASTLDEPAPRRRRWRAPLLATVGIVAGFAAGWLLRPSASDLASDSLTASAVRSHERNLPAEVQEPAELSGFFAGRVPVPVRPPRAPLGGKLKSARIARLQCKDAAELRFDFNGVSATVHVFEPSGLTFRGLPRRHDQRACFVRAERGYKVVVCIDKGVGYAITGDLNERSMLDLARAFWE